MRKSLVALSLVAALSACQQSEPTQSASQVTTAITAEQQQAETKRLNEWFAAKYEEQLQTSPIMMTFLGRKDRYDEVGDFSEEEEKRQLKWQADSVADMKSNFNYDLLTDEGKISYDIWIYQYNQTAEGEKFNHNGYIFTQMQGIQSFAAQFMINFHKVDELSDMQAYNKRIIGLSEGIGILLKRAQVNAEMGVRPPRFAYEGVIDQASNLINGAPFTDSENDAALWQDAKRKVAALVDAKKIDQAQADELLAQSKKVLMENFLPTYQDLVAWFKEDIKNTDEIAQGVANQPNGKAYYNFRLKASTTTNLTADEIHQIGLSEVARLTAEMEAIKEKVGFEGDLQAFFKFIKTDPQFYYPNTDEGRQGYIDDTEAFYATIDKKLPEYFGILPKAGLEVKRVEAFREQPGAAAHYFPGTPDGSRNGIYYLHLSDMSAMPKTELEGVAYHEGNPGHHMQISIAQELESVPQFRTQAGFTAYSEGWGLYSEILAKEMGGYQDPYSDFGRLVNEIWRAVRLVVDTGIHSKGWGEDKAIEYFAANVPTPMTTVKSEVQRYMVLPGQATAYKIGMLKIQELRAMAEKELGDKFDIRGFHDTILGGGAMPLDILERRVKTWIETVKSA
ncbi:DUF885 domain-containing protein [Thalassotalea crassostreae]|uniref:DUF885 domain-containing protein n=1 Tax=Thalassotalea crassostreae TaxID=1763536 RepID=UPI000837DDF8|nr:DUF885 domain-containing protein [Thalassotalea crassostreae]